MASKELFSLGKLYPSDFLKPGEEPRCEPVELKLVMEEDGLVHLEKTAPKEVMWGRYWYRSGVNTSMRNALADIVDSILPLMKFEKNSIFLDIACNDGTLLSFVPKTFIRIGIDPAADDFRNEARRHCSFHAQDYFSKDVFRKITTQKAKVVTSIAMLYDVQKPEEFIRDVYDILDDNGIWVIQVSHYPLMIYQLAFDNIVHEHWSYLSFYTLERMLRRNGFVAMDCQFNDVNGGSFRVYAMKDKADVTKFKTQPFRDVCIYRMSSILEYESHMAWSAANWWDFKLRVDVLKTQVVDFIQSEKLKGKTIWGYGASTKGNTLLQYFALGNAWLDGIADRNKDKWGLRTVGTNIQIYSESDMRKAKPDYLLVLPWHFINEFKERESELLKSGTKFIVPCPKFEIIGYD